MGLTLPLDADCRKRPAALGWAQSDPAAPSPPGEDGSSPDRLV